MAVDQKNSALLKKLSAKLPAPEMAALTPASALRKAAVRAAENTGGLIVSVTSLQEQRSSIPAIIEDLPDHAILMLMSGPDASFGLAVADTQVTAAIIEHQTTGRIVPSPADARMPTKTDTVIVSDLVDRLLAVFELNLAPLDHPPPVSGFRFSMPLESPRAVTMALEEMPYRVYDLTLDFANGAKTGRLQLVFPWFSASAKQLDAKKTRDWTKSLRAATRLSPVPLHAVLHRTSMSYQAIADFKVDDVIEIPNEALSHISIEGQDGVQVASGKLGQVAGIFAVKIFDALQPNRAKPDEQFDLGLTGVGIGGEGRVAEEIEPMPEPNPTPQEAAG